MTDFNSFESAKWAIVSDQTCDKLEHEVEKALAENAARGFPAPGGDTLTAILGASLDAKSTLVEANGKIYEERRGQLFEIEAFTLNYLVRVAKLAMELYREKIFNALAIEQAEADATKERSRADVARMNAQTEERGVAIILNKADMEQRIIVFKQRLVEAETVTLGRESILVDAQLATATKKLEIIDSIYQVLAAEQLVLAAEQRKAAALQVVLVAEKALAEIKKSMVPFYVQKAQAEMALAQATTAEIPTLKAIEELGYDRVALRNAQEEEAHQERLLEQEYQLAIEAFTRAQAAEELARRQSRRILADYRNQVSALIMQQETALKLDEVDFRLATGLAREAIGVRNEVAVSDHDRFNVQNELINLLRNMEARALDETSMIRASAEQVEKHTTDSLFSRRIREGFIVG